MATGKTFRTGQHAPSGCEHPNKSAKWVKAKYFKTVGSRNWVFAAEVNAPDGKPTNLTLATASDIASDTVIRRHVKIKSTANPFDPKDEIYFENRFDWKLKESPTGRKKLARLWVSQEMHCPVCQQPLEANDKGNIHYIRPRSQHLHVVKLVSIGA